MKFRIRKDVPIIHLVAYLTALGGIYQYYFGKDTGNAAFLVAIAAFVIASTESIIRRNKEP